jgi:hypothetical protein
LFIQQRQDASHQRMRSRREGVIATVQLGFALRIEVPTAQVGSALRLRVGELWRGPSALPHAAVIRLGDLSLLGCKGTSLEPFFDTLARDIGRRRRPLPSPACLTDRQQRAPMRLPRRCYDDVGTACHLLRDARTGGSSVTHVERLEPAGIVAVLARSRSLGTERTCQ